MLLIVKSIVDSYVAPYIAWYELLKDLSVEHWIAIIVGSFIFGIIIVNGNDSSHDLLLYGKNRPDKPKLFNSVDLLTRATNYFNKYNVPKSYFKHYYIFFTIYLLTIKTILLNYQIEFYPKMNEVFIKFYEDYCLKYELSDTNYVSLTFASYLLTIQSFRRLYENLFIVKFSKNQMNILHYAFGIVFYAVLGSISFISLLPYYINDYHVEIDFSNLDPFDYVTFGIFAFYSWDQYDNHIYLASLKKYTIPTQRFFEWTASAHYFDEIMIYSAVGKFFIGCEDITWIKVCFSLVWLLVVLNLSISAGQSYKFYQAKFKETFKTPYKIFPYVY